MATVLYFATVQRIPEAMKQLIPINCVRKWETSRSVSFSNASSPINNFSMYGGAKKQLTKSPKKRALCNMYILYIFSQCCRGLCVCEAIGAHHELRMGHFRNCVPT
eukprot:m.457433 g.457433  ORF g.457433 m.457433 type:complete len:106 (-) comp21251_c0_seq1:111-428(-)